MKATKAKAHYRKGDKDRCCALCTMFRPGTPNSCTAVQGAIDRRDLCDYFKRGKAMPWTGKSFKKHNKSLSPSGADKASHIANAILQKSGDEGMAIAVANKKVKGMRKRGRISDKAASKYGMDSDRDVDAATR